MHLAFNSNNSNKINNKIKMDITNFVDYMTTAEITELVSRPNTLDKSDKSDNCSKCIICNNDDCNNYSDYGYCNFDNECSCDNDCSCDDDCLCRNDCMCESEYDSNYEDLQNANTYLHYNVDDDIYDEQVAIDYHQNKNFGNWQYAKMIVSHSYDNANAFTEFLWDYLDIQFQANNDDFNNITKVYYKNDLDIGMIYEFEPVIAKYLVENLKIQSFKPKGYIFNGDENLNKWGFKIVVITTKGIYTANRYITENIIGCY